MKSSDTPKFILDESERPETVASFLNARLYSIHARPMSSLSSYE